MATDAIIPIGCGRDHIVLPVADVRRKAEEHARVSGPPLPVPEHAADNVPAARLVRPGARREAFQVERR